MTKKSIADLLKEEVEKPLSETAKTATAKTATAKTATAKTATAKTATAKTATAKTATVTQATAAKPTTAAKATTAKATATPATSKPTSTAKGTTKGTAKSSAKSAAQSTAKSTPQVTASDTATLNKQIVDLNTAIAKANEQISALQEDIDTHQSRIFELKDSLKTAESSGQQKDTQLKQISAELETAKQTILNLTEAAQKAQEASIAQQKPNQAKTVSNPTTVQKAHAPSTPSKSLTLQQRRPYSSYKSIPEYAIQRGTPAAGQSNSMLNDDDIGWVD